MSKSAQHKTPTPLDACLSALSKYQEDPSPANFNILAALLAPSLFKGQGSFFDNVCGQVAIKDGGVRLPGLLSFMDVLCRAGDLAPAEGKPMAWRSASLLCEIFPEDGMHDPCLFDGLSDLEASISEIFEMDPSHVRIAPLALDLRTVSPSYDFFRFAMLPTQMESIDKKKLAESNPNQALPPGFSEPPRLWKAFMISCAFESDKAPEALAPILAKAVSSGVHFGCSYAMDEQAYSAVIEISAVRDPFSACAAGFEPERLEMQRDFQLLAEKFPSQPSELLAILEPILSPASTLGAAEPLVEHIALSICASDGVVLDALLLPGLPESIALANALLSSAGIPARMAPPAMKALDGNGERLWASLNGRYVFDIANWRQRVLGVDDEAAPRNL